MDARYKFDIVKSRLCVKTQCRCCGKKLTRVVACEHTVNPFNMTADGRTKTYAEVRSDTEREVLVDANKLRKHGTVCAACNARAQIEDLENKLSEKETQ